MRLRCGHPSPTCGVPSFVDLQKPMPKIHLVLDDHMRSAYRTALGGFATGIAVVLAPVEDHAIGLTVNSFTSVSLDPPLVLWCLGDKSDRGVHFRPAPGFVVNILSADQRDIAERCAKRGRYRFEREELDHAYPGLPALPGALTRLWCENHDQIILGDHIAMVGRVQAFDHQIGDGLTYFSGGYGRASCVQETQG